MNRKRKADSAKPELDWVEERPVAENYRLLGVALAACRDLYRRPGHDGGLILVRGNGHSVILRGADLAWVIVDRLKLRVWKGGKLKGGLPPTTHLQTMLHSEAFLAAFRVVDLVSNIPRYLPDFSLTDPGYNDGGEGHCILYLGEPAVVSDDMTHITQFLSAMAFADPADLANAVAAALTVMLHTHWPGAKPIILVTATKSHAGKDTVIAFAAGEMLQQSISYQHTDWALERAAVGVLKSHPDTVVLTIENARTKHTGCPIASAWLERTTTDPCPILYSTGSGAPVRRRNDLVFAISTNFGAVSEDIANRSLPIHLAPVGDIAARKSPIGNPKEEYLPQHRGAITAELRGMIQRWVDAGMPTDDDVKHTSFSCWAKTIGGILRVNGFTHFLANLANRKVSDDPVRRGLAILAGQCHDEWQRPDFWARLACDQGVAKAVIPHNELETEASRQRGIGVVLSNHRDETFSPDGSRRKYRLEKDRKRFDGAKPHTRYRFVTISND